MRYWTCFEKLFPRATFCESGVKKDMEAVAALERDAELMLRVREGDDTSFALLLERHRGAGGAFPVQDGAESVRYQRNWRRKFFCGCTAAGRLMSRQRSLRRGCSASRRIWRLNWIRDGKKEKGQESLDEELLDGVERQVADRQPTVEQAMLYEVKLREVRQAIEMLPEKQRAAVMMHKYEELEYSQIAKALNCSESAVKSLLFRAYETLRARLAHMA